jgi:hypothetical protein
VQDHPVQRPFLFAALTRLETYLGRNLTNLGQNFTKLHKTCFFNKVRSHLLSKTSKTFILLTSCNDDFCMPFFNYPIKNVNNSNMSIQLLQCPKLDTWYTKNPCITFQKLKPFPIGPKWQWKSGGFFGEYPTTHLNIYTKHGMNGYENFQNKNTKPNLLYFNYGCSTTDNPFIQSYKNIRNIWKKNIETKFKWNTHKPIEEYMIELSSYKFCLSPPGRGVDTHRTWEAMYFKCVPIVLRSFMTSYYEEIGLPIWVVDSYSDIEDFDESALGEMYKQFQGKFAHGGLWADYWIHSIQAISEGIRKGDDTSMEN